MALIPSNENREHSTFNIELPTSNEWGEDRGQKPEVSSQWSLVSSQQPELAFVAINRQTETMKKDGNRSSAELDSAVSRICNPLAAANGEIAGHGGGVPNAIRRYSGLQIRATFANRKRL